MPTNDNDSLAPGASPEAHAALLLVESLIHGLRENGTLGPDHAVAIAERAAEVQYDHAEAADGAGAPLWRSHGLLVQIAKSLKADGGEIPPPRLVP